MVFKSRDIIPKIIIGLLCGLLMAFISLLPPVKNLELKCVDWRFKIRGTQRPDDRVVIVAIDEQSMGKIEDPLILWGPHFAQVIDGLFRGEVGVVGLDILQLKPIDEYLPGHDRPLKEMLARYREKIVLPYLLFSNQEQAQASLWASDIDGLGMINLTTDADDSVRRQMLIGVDEYGLEHPCFALKILERYLGERVFFEENRLRIGNKGIPLRDGRILINYAGPPDTFKKLSFVEVLDRIKKDDYAWIRENFGGKIVLIGNISSPDAHPTPFYGGKRGGERLMPGVEIQANIINTILRDNYIQRVEVPGLLVLVGLGVTSTFLFFYFGPVGDLIIMIGLMVGLGWGAEYLFVVHNRLIELISPLGEIPLVYLTVFAYRFMTEEREKRRIKQTFSRYVPPDVVEELVSDPASLSLGGKRAKLSVLFSDIVGFASMSEKMEPERVVSILNEYFSLMNEVIFDNKGTLDKFIGDAVMVIYGAPIYQKDHAKRAVMTALKMREELKNLQQKETPINIGIGINTGEMVVGNIGSEIQTDYTVIGDEVNLASRLEGMTREYKVPIIIGENTYQEIKDEIEARELDVIRVKGRDRPVTIYEVMGLKGEFKDEQREILEDFARTLLLYRERRWKEAARIFSEHKDKDGACRLYCDRCEEYDSSPPPADWDGVYEYKTK